MNDDTFHALWRAILDAHSAAARDNDNLSKLAGIAAYQGSGSIPNAIAAACLTLGHLHAPLIQARDVYDHWQKSDVDAAMASHHRVAGFGNSFHRNGDPAFGDFRRALPASDRVRIEQLELWVGIPANAALYTAAFTGLAGLAPEDGWRVFLEARVPVWLDACLAVPLPVLGSRSSKE